MPDYLLIRGQSAERVVDALVVAAEIVDCTHNAQVDIVTPVAYVDYLRVSDAVRRVVAVEPPDLPARSDFKEKEADWRKTLLRGVSRVASATGKNLQSYRALAEELRLVEYDAVFDFDASAFSVAVARLVKSRKIIGFSTRGDEEIPSAIQLMYHETYCVDEPLSHSMRLRRLVAQYLNYSVLPMDWCLRQYPLPANIPPPPCLLLGGDIPAPFFQLLQQANMPLIGLPEADVAALTAADIVSLSRHATAVCGNGVVTALAVAVDATTWFIGNPRDTPEGAVNITTPTALTEVLRSCIDDKQPSPADDEHSTDSITAQSPPKKLTIRLKDDEGQP